ncbi:MAG: hypothetical protein U9N34_10505, partial [Candidatus Cloacimonadota bacterium]|nr:hypothetical protein [Candidatus Cloacimonadota bacterium]
GFSKEKKPSSSGVKYLCLYTKCRYSVAFDDVFSQPNAYAIGLQKCRFSETKNKTNEKLLFEY